jgi:hypothetical protein
MANPEGFAESIRQRVACLISDIDDLADFLDENGLLLAMGDDLTTEQARALGWLEGAAEALGMTVLEFVDANT